jgi:CelD/BcsL family acetyltransferase involved in cellulose biosynthesis
LVVVSRHFAIWKKMRLELHQDPSDLIKLEVEWNNLLERGVTNTVFQTWEWNQLWWKHFGHLGRLLLLTVRDSEGGILGIAPLFQNSDGGSQKSVQFLGGTDLSDYLDFIVIRGKESVFYSAVAEFFRTHHGFWDVIDLHCVPATSPTIEWLDGFWQEREFQKTLSVEDVCPRTQLPSSWKAFLSGMRQKDRHEIRRKINKIGREAENYGYCATTLVSFPDDISSFLALHRKSAATKTAFMNTRREEFFRDVARRFLQKGWLELSFLEADRSRVASLFNFKYGDTIYVYNSGYDPEFRHWSPGWVLISHSIEDAIKRGVKTYDFLRGNESYKYRFKAENFEIYQYTIQRREERFH